MQSCWFTRSRPEHGQRDFLGLGGQESHRGVALEERIFGGQQVVHLKRWSGRVNMVAPPCSAARAVAAMAGPNACGAPGRLKLTKWMPNSIAVVLLIIRRGSP